MAGSPRRKTGKNGWLERWPSHQRDRGRLRSGSVTFSGLNIPRAYKKIGPRRIWPMLNQSPIFLPNAPLNPARVRPAVLAMRVEKSLRIVLDRTVPRGPASPPVEPRTHVVFARKEVSICHLDSERSWADRSPG